MTTPTPPASSTTLASPTLGRPGSIPSASPIIRLLNQVADRRNPAQVKIGSALFPVVAAWVLVAWNRFGLAGVDQPRLAARIVVIGLWGWVALSLLLWLAITVLRSDNTVSPARPDNTDTLGAIDGAEIVDDLDTSNAGITTDPDAETIFGFDHYLQAAGRAHFGLIAIGFTVMLAAGLGRILGPGWVVAIGALAGWMPLRLVGTLRRMTDLGLGQLVIRTTIPYLAWVAAVAIPGLSAIKHLL